MRWERKMIPVFVHNDGQNVFEEVESECFGEYLCFHQNVNWRLLSRLPLTARHSRLPLTARQRRLLRKTHRYTITHIPTGFSATTIKTKSDAKTLIELLMRVFGDAFSQAKEKDVCDKLPRGFVSWMRAIADGGRFIHPDDYIKKEDMPCSTTSAPKSAKAKSSKR